MEATWRPWTDASLAVLLAVLAVAFARPVLLAGAVLVAAWVLACQFQFATDVGRTARSLAVDQLPGRTGVRTDESTPVTLAASLERPTPISLEIRAGLPTGASADEQLAVDLEPGAERAARTLEVSWPVAGRHRFRPATVALGDGFFAETLSMGEQPTTVVEPRGPRRIHVGAGGEQVASAFGEHDAGDRGSGVVLSDLREYAPGDRADRIDWKATARLNTPHVREYEAETDRRTLLVFDHRSSLSSGLPGETKLDLLVEVALATAASARRLGDPVGLLTIGDGGVTTRLEPTSTPDAYLAIRRQLLELEPTESTTTSDASVGSAPANDGRAGTPPARGHRRNAAAVQRSAPSADGGNDPFAETLRPFYDDYPSYRERIDDDPLFRGLRRTLAAQGRSTWAVIFSDDDRPAELREAVELARAKGHEVMVVLAPSVLFEPGGLADVERAYERYTEFEAFRRSLARIDRVTALEAGPDDRLAAVLEAGASRGGRA